MENIITSNAGHAWIQLHNCGDRELKKQPREAPCKPLHLMRSHFNRRPAEKPQHLIAFPRIILCRRVRVKAMCSGSQVSLAGGSLFLGGYYAPAGQKSTSQKNPSSVLGGYLRTNQSCTLKRHETRQSLPSRFACFVHGFAGRAAGCGRETSNNGMFGSSFQIPFCSKYSAARSAGLLRFVE